jgi:hypothetical protein
MENAVDAIKLAFALLVFAIAITLTISVIGQARATADAVFTSVDKTEFYEYATNGDYNAVEDRIVSFETILPTIHRYAKEQYAVTIFDSNGIPIARFDLFTEGFMANWNETIKNLNSGNERNKQSAQETYNSVKERLEQVQSVVNKELGTNVDIMEYIGTSSTIYSSSKLLYSGKTNDSSDIITVVSPWVGEPDTDTVERIKADLNGSNYVKDYNGTTITYYGKNLKQYQDKTFKEKFIEIATSGETLTDGNDSIETIRGNKKLEIIYIMQ